MVEAEDLAAAEEELRALRAAGHDVVDASFLAIMLLTRKKACKEELHRLREVCAKALLSAGYCPCGTKIETERCPCCSRLYLPPLDVGTRVTILHPSFFYQKGRIKQVVSEKPVVYIIRLDRGDDLQIEWDYVRPDDSI